MMISKAPSQFPSRLRFTAGRRFAAGLFVLLLGTACTYNAPEGDLCSMFDGAPLKDAIGDPPAMVLMDPLQRFAVFHGSACAQSDEDGRENIIKVEQSLQLPAFANQATVFLNGWKVKYLHKDHEVQGVGSLIGKIGLKGGTLSWQAAGILSDKNFDDAYEWCYHYTVIAWNDLAVSAAVDHDDADKFCHAQSPESDNFFFAPNDSTTTALAAFTTFLQNDAFAAPGQVAVLPRGFGFREGDDHHLLQLAYNLDHSEGYVEHGKTYRKGFAKLKIPATTISSRADSGFVSWETFAILKDNSTRRSYEFGELVSALGGRDVGIVQPSYSILPIEDGSSTATCDLSGQPDILTEEFVVEHIPFECAVPMLTGWELEYGCSDHQVTEMGIWIDEWSYALGGQGGTLRYKVSSVLRDKDGKPEHGRTKKVAILGLIATDLPFGPGGSLK